jgi:hypothetical protein
MRPSRLSVPFGLFAGALYASAALAQSAAPSTNSKTMPAATAAAGSPTRLLPDRFAAAAGRYYKLVWGIDSLSVKTMESGEIIRFSWHVIDPSLAKPLSDKKAVPSLVDPQGGVSLVIPDMENIGQLRQTSTPEAGKSYWMAFSNKGRVVKRGHRVNVVIGGFRADGLVVE